MDDTVSTLSSPSVSDALGDIDADIGQSLREDFVCSAFSAVLQRDWVDAGDDFFALGGDSLRATIAVVELRERIDAGLSTRRFFELRSAARLAPALARTAAGLDTEDAASESSAIYVVRKEARARAVPAVPARFSARRPDLGRWTRKLAQTDSIAPCVVYLSAWLDVVASLARGFPLELRLGPRAAAGASCWMLGTSSDPELARANRGTAALQRQLLRGPSSAATPGTTEASCAFRYVRTAQATAGADVAPSGSTAAVELTVVEGPDTRFELVVRAGRDGTEEDMLDEYLARLSRLLRPEGPRVFDGTSA